MKMNIYYFPYVIRIRKNQSSLMVFQSPPKRDMDMAPRVYASLPKKPAGTASFLYRNNYSLCALSFNNHTYKKAVRKYSILPLKFYFAGLLCRRNNQ